MIIDTQSVRAAAGVPKTTTGLDANKKTPGRKRGPAVDVLGLIIGVVVMAAGAHDNDAGIALLSQAGLPAASRTGLPTDEVTVNITRSRLGRLARQGVLTQPGRGLHQKRMQRPLSGLGSAWSTAATLA